MLYLSLNYIITICIAVNCIPLSQFLWKLWYRVVANPRPSVSRRHVNKTEILNTSVSVTSSKMEIARWKNTWKSRCAPPKRWMHHFGVSIDNVTMKEIISSRKSYPTHLYCPRQKKGCLNFKYLMINVVWF